MNSNTKSKVKLICFWILITCVTSITAQPIIYTGYGKANWWKINEYNREMYLLKDTTFAFYDLDALLVGDKNLVKYTYKSKDREDEWNFKSDKEFVINGVTFLDSLINDDDFPEDDFSKRLLYSTEIRLRFQDCKASLLELSGIKSHSYLTWLDNKFSEIQFRGMKVGLFAERNYFHSFVSWNGKFDSFFLSGIKSDRKRLLMEFYWNAFRNGFIFMNDSSQHTVLSFSEDSLNRVFKLENTFLDGKFRDSTSLKCYFSKSWLNAKFYIPYTGKKGGVYFTDCVFGKEAELVAMNFDTIYFNRCTINSPLYLEFDTTSNPVYISFVNQDIDNIQFNFSERVHLYFDPDLSKDYILSTYDRLLAKFKKEGKLESYKNVDIAYKKYASSQNGLVGNFLTILNRYWWNYGYNKEYILYWTFIFLFLFHIVNYLFWGKMKKVYDIIPPADQLKRKEEGKFRFFLRQQLGIFIYTAYIFFSLRVDFSKLKYKYGRVLVLFFVQYIGGLICLFFIANAILKL